MKSVLCAVSFALATAMPFAAAAAELEPLQAGTFVLGTQSVSIFYTVSGDTYEVVTTIAPTGTAGAPIRFVGFLQPGQKALVSAGKLGTTAAPDTLELVHQGDVLSATEVARVAAAD